MKVNIQIKNRRTSHLIFELEIENNTILKTLEKALASGANLRDADLYVADLRDADLRGANLRGADLYGANLRGADLRGADLHGTNLRDANLYVADLRGADLRDADLRGANLRGADLRGANLHGADLRGTKNADLITAQTLIVGEGDVIGWKKCQNDMLVKLLIPTDARRHNATGRKCRAEFADVLEIIDMNDKSKKPTQAVSQYDKKVIYEVGKRMVPDKYEPNRFEECAGGIHFFITRIEAEQYN